MNFRPFVKGFCSFYLLIIDNFHMQPIFINRSFDTLQIHPEIVRVEDSVRREKEEHILLFISHHMKT